MNNRYSNDKAFPIYWFTFPTACKQLDNVLSIIKVQQKSILIIHKISEKLYAPKLLQGIHIMYSCHQKDQICKRMLKSNYQHAEHGTRSIDATDSIDNGLKLK